MEEIKDTGIETIAVGEMSEDELEAQAEKQLKSQIAAMNEEELVKYLESLNPIQAYVVIRDYIQLLQMKKMRALSSREDKSLYQRFQDVKKVSKEYWDYDNKVALIKDVNKVGTNVYTALLRMIKEVNDSSDQTFTKVMAAINRIEGHLGIDKTVWEDETQLDVDQSIESSAINTNTEDNEDAGSKNEQGIS